MTTTEVVARSFEFALSKNLEAGDSIQVLTNTLAKTDKQLCINVEKLAQKHNIPADTTISSFFSALEEIELQGAF